MIDTSFDVRTDAGGNDPDSHSATLRHYHRLLWGKALPDGRPFELGAKLRHSSALGEFWLSSDSISHSYSYWTRPARLVEVIGQIPTSELAAFEDLGCTVGGYTVFPFATYADGKWPQTINQARGTRSRIRDRFDLTLECIRRHYEDGPSSPLKDVLQNYREFFALFGSFDGYVGHFLLDDLIADDGGVRFFLPFGDFDSDPLPMRDVDEYREYMTRSMAFTRARNARIDRWVRANLTDELERLSEKSE